MRRLLFALTWLVCASVASAQVPVAIAPVPHQQFFDITGAPLAGGLVFTYIAGTTTPQATYVDAVGLIQNTNPIVLDSGGFATIWLAAASYKMCIQNSLGVQQWCVDNINQFGILSGNTWLTTQTFNAGIVVLGGGSLTGTFSGNPIFSGNPTFSGAVGISGVLTANSLATANFDNIVFIDGTTYPRTAAGIQSALNSFLGSPGTIILTPGAYDFSAGGVTVSHLRQNIIGMGKWVTEIDFPGPGAAFTFSTGTSAVLYQNQIGGMLFNGALDIAGTNQKIAVRAIDTSEFYMHDIVTQNWKGNSGSSSTPSIGLWVEGRELGVVERLQMNADRPIYIDLDPNIAAENLDSWTFRDIYNLVQVSTESSIVFAQGTIARHNRFIGIDCIFGASCILWNESTAVASTSYQNVFTSVHHEQATGGSYSYNFGRSNAGAQFNQELRLEGVEADPISNGFFFQRTHNLTLINGIHQQPGGTAFNADNTNFNCSILGSQFQTGSTITNQCVAANVDHNQLVALEFPETTGGPNPTPGSDNCGAISSLHRIVCTYNAGGILPLPQLVSNGIATLGVSAISSATCAAVVTQSATGVLATDVVTWSPGADDSLVTGYGPAAGGSLTIHAFPSANAVNFKVCNATVGSITPGALSLNWTVSR